MFDRPHFPYDPDGWKSGREPVPPGLLRFTAWTISAMVFFACGSPASAGAEGGLAGKGGVMRTLSGAVLVLAGALLFAAGVVGEQVCHAANRYPTGNVNIAYVGAAGLTVVG